MTVTIICLIIFAIVLRYGAYDRTKPADDRQRDRDQSDT
jgi:hypothetical protein